VKDMPCTLECEEAGTKEAKETRSHHLWSCLWKPCISRRATEPRLVLDKGSVLPQNISKSKFNSIASRSL
jgi:hypothetical protein